MFVCSIASMVSFYGPAAKGLSSFGSSRGNLLLLLGKIFGLELSGKGFVDVSSL